LFQDGGSIILTASIGGSKGFEAYSYSATKAAIRSFARSWTVDLKHRKILVNAVSPGPIATPMATSAGMGLSEEVEQIKKSFTNRVPLGRMGNPDEVANAVAFLASDDSSYITGIELFVDGGNIEDRELEALADRKTRLHIIKHRGIDYKNYYLTAGFFFYF
jgi:NAD(P)-dependent dehydrogenase (short-subunit alcohol dehydrogenase family)